MPSLDFLSSSLFITFLKGFLIGATMMIPGLSGGSMAMILGIYDKLISAVGSFQKSPLNNFLFLFLFSAGAGSGMFLCSRPLSWLLVAYPFPTIYFFLGAVIGGIPLIEKKSGIKTVSFDVLFYLLLGLLLVIGMTKLPSNLISCDNFSISVLIVIGVISSIALILPGISFSHFLLLLGFYDKLLTAIRSLQLNFLFPMGIGILVGLLLFTKILELWMVHRPKSAYLTILGFVLGSALMIFPGLPAGKDIIICTFLAGCGFLSVAVFSSKE